jgi:hypothetical protein
MTAASLKPVVTKLDTSTRRDTRSSADWDDRINNDDSPWLVSVPVCLPADSNIVAVLGGYGSKHILPQLTTAKFNILAKYAGGVFGSIMMYESANERLGQAEALSTAISTVARCTDVGAVLLHTAKEACSLSAAHEAIVCIRSEEGSVELRTVRSTDAKELKVKMSAGWHVGLDAVFKTGKPWQVGDCLGNERFREQCAFHSTEVCQSCTARACVQ